MCTERCRTSLLTRCKCECGGLQHGIKQRTPEETAVHLNNNFPPCTPVRLIKTSDRGSVEGKIDYVFMGKVSWYVVLQGQNHEIVPLEDCEVIK